MPRETALFPKITGWRRLRAKQDVTPWLECKSIPGTKIGELCPIVRWAELSNCSHWTVTVTVAVVRPY